MKKKYDKPWRVQNYLFIRVMIGQVDLVILLQRGNGSKN